MKNIDYFKLQAKNLYHDFQLDFMQEGDTYIINSRFFNVNAVVNDFDIQPDQFTLMKAQHVIALMVGMSSWKELIEAPKDVLEQKKVILNTSDYKLHRQKVYNIDLSKYEVISKGVLGDYVLKCPLLPELKEIMTLKLNCAFRSCSPVEECYKDTEYAYVNVLPEISQIRVLVPGFLGTKPCYAVSVRNIGKM